MKEPVGKNMRKLDKQDIHPAILFVDDSVIRRCAAVIDVGKLGMWCDVVPSAKRATQVFSAKSYDLVFIRLDLPDMDGCDLAAELRNIECRMQQSDRSIICGTIGNLNAPNSPRCHASGVNSIIKRPVTPEDVRDMVRAAQGVMYAKMLRLDAGRVHGCLPPLSATNVC